MNTMFYQLLSLDGKSNDTFLFHIYNRCPIIAISEITYGINVWKIAEKKACINKGNAIPLSNFLYKKNDYSRLICTI